jgi:AcrR family transcriptional regulator
MSELQSVPSQRRARAHETTRAAILDAARRVAAREGARDFSWRAVAAEAGFAPAALYSYFSGKSELVLALAAEDLAQLSRAMRGAALASNGKGRLAATAGAALDLLKNGESIAAAAAALCATAEDGEAANEAERLFNGRLIAALTVLAQAMEAKAESREAQCDVLLIAAALGGLALLARAGRLAALGFSPEDLIARLEARFAPAN